ncbi:hypothetical protein ACEPAG_8285 [Sanghuangporus baumii]
MEHTVQGLEMGTVLVNSWFAIALSGVMLLQSYMYFRAKPQQDNSIFGILVIALIILDLAHVACIMTTLYHYLIRSFGQNKELEILVPSLAVSSSESRIIFGPMTTLSLLSKITVGLTGTITFLAQSFFTWRVWKLSQNVIIVTVVVGGSNLLESTNHLSESPKARASGCSSRVKYGTFVAWTHKVRWVFTIGLILSVICDIILTSSLCYWLRESRTGVHGMDEKIDKIILYSIENGVLTCAISMITLICAIVMPKNLVFAGLHFIISKLYINSVLASCVVYL